jgi:hypothetical protein
MRNIVIKAVSRHGRVGVLGLLAALTLGGCSASSSGHTTSAQSISTAPATTPAPTTSAPTTPAPSTSSATSVAAADVCPGDGTAPVGGDVSQPGQSQQIVEISEGPVATMTVTFEIKRSAASGTDTPPMNGTYTIALIKVDNTNSTPLTFANNVFTIEDDNENEYGTSSEVTDTDGGWEQALAGIGPNADNDPTIPGETTQTLTAIYDMPLTSALFNFEYLDPSTNTPRIYTWAFNSKVAACTHSGASSTTAPSTLDPKTCLSSVTAAVIKYNSTLGGQDPNGSASVEAALQKISINDLSDSRERQTFFAAVDALYLSQQPYNFRINSAKVRKLIADGTVNIKTNCGSTG